MQHSKVLGSHTASLLLLTSQGGSWGADGQLSNDPTRAHSCTHANKPPPSVPPEILTLASLSKRLTAG